MKTIKKEFSDEDPIVAEVRKARASLTKGFKSTRAYIEYLRDNPKPGREYVSLPPRKPTKLRKAG